MEQLLQRLSTSKHVTWLMSQAVVLATAGSYALVLALTMLPNWAHYGGLFRLPDLGGFQVLGLCVVLALPVLLVRRLLGMRERVTSLSGQFSAGRRPEGGFRVAARLPA
ncbi:hypothetical protein AB0C76_28605 [Kitasatospora sp. NPDC048722]|uniref:hypothetical protein n=1 Tax=Kitasatospora sp. NPDC048722 TaxID=3155639 RepID=UPI0033FF4A8E